MKSEVKGTATSKRLGNTAIIHGSSGKGEHKININVKGREKSKES
jgi:hypothetical protein